MIQRIGFILIPNISKFISYYIASRSYTSNIFKVQKRLDLSYASYEITDTSLLKAPPLVILHGLLGSKSHYNGLSKKYLEKTQPNRKIFAIDLRNHGDSIHLPQNDYDTLILDIKRFLEEKEIDKVSLLGHDIGGRVAMLIALKYPDVVDSLIVSDISPITTSESFKRLSKLLKALQKISFPVNTPLTEAKTFIGIQLAPIIRQPKLLGFLLLNLVQQTDGRYTWKFNLRAISKYYEELASFPQLHNVIYEGPVLFLGGAKSDYIQKSDFPKIQKLFPNAELKYIEGAGHWLHSEKPNEFLQITLEFLNRGVSPN